MIISVDLIKGTYYLNGEHLIAHVTIKQDKNSLNSAPILAWVCAQIHCLCSFDNEKLKSSIIDYHKVLPHLGLTSLNPNYGENGFCVYASEPKILISDVCLEDQIYDLFYEETIPYSAFPSYRGMLCKYAYKLTISAQYLAAPVNFVRIPFKVLVLQGLSPELMNTDDVEENSPSNHFLTTSDVETSRFSMEKALALIQDIISYKNIRHYNVMSNARKVCKLSIAKSYYRLGDYIPIYLDFRDAALNCVEVYACLIDEEELQLDNEVFNLITKHKMAKSEGDNTNSRLLVLQGLKYSEIREYTLNTALLPLTFHVPTVVTPTFTTNIVKHRWLIHFEFTFTDQIQPFQTQKTIPTILPFRRTSLANKPTTISPSKMVDNPLTISRPNSPNEDWVIPPPAIDENSPKYNNIISSSTKVPLFYGVETMVWDLPIKLFPTNPINISAQFSVGKISTVI